MKIVANIMSEQSPLLSHQHLRRFKYRLTCIRSRAGVLVLLLDMLFQVYKLCMSYFILAVFGIYPFHGGTEFFFVIPFLFYPIGGLIADVWIGRYRIIVISGYICLLAWLSTVTGYSLHWYIHNELYIPVSIIILTIACLFLVSGSAGFQSNILPFNIDQMMGASGDQLSAVIQWHVFGNFIVFSVPVSAIKSLSDLYFLLPSLIISCITIILIILSHCVFKNWLDTTPQITNPIKLIVKVLNYARKNKYPRNRSALTYWENDYPSRLDLGKEKYGGPFSEEEVEDVKTVLRLLPLLICGVGFSISWGTYNLPIDVSGFDSDNMSRFIQSYIKENRIPFFVCSLLFPFYQFIIYPCFYKYIPSMLKRIGLGMVIGLISILVIMIVVIWFGEFSDPSFECPSNIDNSSNTSTIVLVNYKWLLIPHITFGCTLFLVVATALEFTVAQSPKQMRGLMVGLCYAFYGIGAVVSNGLTFVFISSKIHSRGCISYFIIVNFILIVFTLIYFVMFAKRYKLRSRDNIVPVHQIAEEHYERYFYQSEEYRRENETEIHIVSN